MNESKKGESPGGTARRSTSEARFSIGGLTATRQEDIKSEVASGAASLARDHPYLELLRQAELSAEFGALRDSIAELHRCMGEYGGVEVRGEGLRGRVEVLVNSVLRKSILRHIDQQKEVHRALGVVVGRLTALLEAEQLLADRNAERLIDAAVRDSLRRPGA
jgi:hypothetical protein